jgi:hypothetical protein
MSSRAQIQLFCAESGQPLQRHTSTDNTSGRHKCTCHNEYCVVKCNVCGFIGYTSLGSHGQSHKNHIIAKEPGSTPTTHRNKRQRKSEESSGESSASEENDNDEASSSSDEDVRESSMENDIESVIPLMSDLMQARLTGFIGGDMYQRFKPLILTMWSQEELTILFMKLKECLADEKEGRMKWDDEGLPLFNSVLSLYAKKNNGA